MEELKTWSVSQYCTSINKLLRQRVPDVWVHGVISQLNIRGRVAYLQIAEYKEDDSRPVSTLSLFMFTSEFEAMNERLAQEIQPFKIEVDLKVSFLLEADFYVPMGKFQARIKDIDPNFTLGELAITRKKILLRLEEQGLLNKNSRHALSLTPLKVGLITAEGSAAHNDFMEIINQSRYAFDVIVASAKMQGQETEATVLKALKSLAKKDIDVLCICRGGGSKTDLVYFDSEVLCVEIAHYPVPVITGIGHQIDTSLVDLVAWSNKITPTACARFLVECLDEQWGRVIECKEQLRRSWELILQVQNEAIYSVGYSILNRAPQLLDRERETLKRHKTGLLRGPQKLIIQHGLKFDSFKNSIGQIWKRTYQRENTLIQNSVDILRSGFKAKVQLSASELKSAILTLKNRYRAISDLQNVEIRSKEKLIRSLDPKRTLERGYSITRIASKTGKGQIPDFSSLHEGDILITEFKDGTVFSNITSKEV